MFEEVTGHFLVLLCGGLAGNFLLGLLFGCIVPYQWLKRALDGGMQ